MTNVYGLYDPTTEELRYIGKTVHKLATRLSGHISKAVRDNKTHVQRWIKSLHDQGIRPDIRLIEIVEDGGNDAECRLIKLHREAGAKLCNLTDGGDGGIGNKWTVEQRERIRQAGIAKATPEYRLKIAAKVRTAWVARGRVEPCGISALQSKDERAAAQRLYSKRRRQVAKAACLKAMQVADMTG